MQNDTFYVGLGKGGTVVEKKRRNKKQSKTDCIILSDCKYRKQCVHAYELNCTTRDLHIGRTAASCICP